MIMAIIAIDVDIAAKLLFGLRSKMFNGGLGVGDIPKTVMTYRAPAVLKTTKIAEMMKSTKMARMQK